MVGWARMTGATAIGEAVGRLRRRAARFGAALCVGASVLGAPAPDAAWAQQDWRPEEARPLPAEGERPTGPSERRQRRRSAPLDFETPDGAFSIGPTGNIQYDAGTYFGQSGGDPVGPDAVRGTLRRARVGVSGRLFRDFDYAFVWNFSGFQRDGGSLDTLSLSYSGLGPLTFVAGAFKPRFTLEDTQGSNDLLFLERAAVVTAASSLAAGTARVGGGVEASLRRLFAAAYLTGGDAAAEGDGRQRGAVVRLAGAPVYEGSRRVLHLGVSASWVQRPPLSPAGNEVVRLSERPELRTGSARLLDTGRLLAGDARSAGIELGASWNRSWAQAEYHRVEVDRSGEAPSATFEGWYAQAAYVVAGRSRRWRRSRAAWGRPEPSRPFDPARGRWGALEVGLRYSSLDLDAAGARGGRQGIWTAGLNWFPTESLRVTAQYQNGRVTPARDDDPVRFQAVAIRLQTSF